MDKRLAGVRFIPKPLPDLVNTKDIDWDEYDKLMKNNFNMLMEIDKASKAAGMIVGRAVFESVADGRAAYPIIKENKTTVRVRWLPGVCADDYVFGVWGDGEATVNKEYVLQGIRFRDFWDEQSSKKNS